MNLGVSIGRLAFLVLLYCFLGQSSIIASTRIVIVMIDGGRYAETLGSKAVNMPHIWNELRKEGTIYTNFRNDGITKTCAGHASVLSGTWQQLKNDGSERSTAPTLFEYYREQTSSAESTCYIISGKSKLSMLTYCTDSLYGKRYGAKFVVPAEKGDIATWRWS